MQQVLSSLDVLVHGYRLSGHTAYSTAPPGEKLSDVQFGRHADLCQKDVTIRKRATERAKSRKTTSHRNTPLHTKQPLSMSGSAWMTSFHLRNYLNRHHGSFRRSLSSGLFLLPLTCRLDPASAKNFLFSFSAVSPRTSASSSKIHPPAGGNTRRRSAGLKPDESPFASRSASRFTSRGAHLTSGRTPERRSCSPNSIRSAESGYLLDISLFRSAPFPLLSV